MSFERDGFEFSVEFADAIEWFGAEALPNLIDVVRRVYSNMRGQSLLGPLMAVRVLDRPPVFARPPRTHPRWSTGNVVDFYSKDFHEHHPQGNPEAFNKIRTAPLPSGVQRHQEEGLVVIQWAHEPISGEALDEAARSQRKWLGELLNLPIRPDFNEQGDHRVPATLAKGPNPFTFLDEAAGYAYKGLVLDRDGKLHINEEADVRAAIESRRLRDGTELKKIFAFLPSREAAMQSEQPLRRMGFDGVLYVGNDEHLWDPNPPHYGPDWRGTRE